VYIRTQTKPMKKKTKNQHVKFDWVVMLGGGEGIMYSSNFCVTVRFCIDMLR